MTFKPLFAAIALAIATTSGAAFADVGDVAHIRYDDLDMSSPVGRQTFAHRLGGAIGRVCGAPDAGSRFAVATCRSTAQRDAREQLRELGDARF